MAALAFPFRTCNRASSAVDAFTSRFLFAAQLSDNGAGNCASVLINHEDRHAARFWFTTLPSEEIAEK